MQDSVEITVFQRVVEQLVPAVEHDLRGRGGNDDGEDRQADPCQLPAHRQGSECLPHHFQVTEKSAVEIKRQGLAVGLSKRLD